MVTLNSKVLRFILGGAGGGREGECCFLFVLVSFRCLGNCLRGLVVFGAVRKLLRRGMVCDSFQRLSC